MDLINIGRYEIKKELGRGGMATVYLAYDPNFDREVAIKILPREFLHNPEFLERFQREVKTIAQLEHPAIVPVHDVGTQDGMPYLVMRYMPGGSLSDRISQNRFSLEDTARMIERLAAALSYAHRKGVVHRDLKPDNILFNADNYPFISDFGIAKFAGGSNLTGSGIIGTPAYMSPEQATGDTIDHRSDVYGLGIIAYQMLTGQQPYKADTPMGVAIKHVTDPVPDIRIAAPELSWEVSDVMKKVLAKDRELRYPTAVEFARALNQAAFGVPGNIRESTPTVPPSTTAVEKPAPVAVPVRSSNSKFYAAGAGILLIVVAVAFAAVKMIAGMSPAEAPSTGSTDVPVLVTVVATLPQTEASSLAPSCSEDVTSPLSSLIQETKRGCRRVNPYTNYLIPKGATFTTQDPEFSCILVSSDENGDLISCTGKQLSTFGIEICNVPVGDQLALDSGQCQAGSGYDEANHCCAPVSPEGTSCFIFTAETMSCQ